jgi:recombination DNA repair RAD52 pathway protein
MTTKELIRQKVELLDEDQARLILMYIEQMIRTAELLSAELDSPETNNESRRDPMLDVIGIARSAEPTNIAEFKDEYIADAIMHWREAETEATLDERIEL